MSSSLNEPQENELQESAAQALVADWNRNATRHETPCGGGALVWRHWPGGGPALVLLHGAQGAWSHWIRNLDALARRYSLWIPDLPGCGESTAATFDDHGAISQALAHGLRQLLGNELPALIVGFSLGGVVGAQLAARHPDVARRLVIVGSGGLGTPVGKISMQRVAGLEGSARQAALRHNLLQIMLARPASVDALAMHLLVLNARNCRIDARALVEPDLLEQALARVRCRVDAIWGEQDRVHFDPAVQHAAILKRAPRATMRIVANAGHWAMYEEPEAFNETLLELLGKELG
jgi:pimeloyl-ACP methyl ester carboxylesterase